jgi:hypothetical protein
MRRLKLAASSVLVILLLFDALLVNEYYRYGPPVKVEGIEGRLGEAVFKVEKIPLSGQDWTMLVALITLHGFVIYVLWRLRRKIAATPAKMAVPLAGD